MSLKAPDFQVIRSRTSHISFSLLQSTDVDKFVEWISSNQKRGASAEADLVFNGAAVTLPHKVIMTQHVDIIDVNAKAVGAINTIYVRFDNSGTPLNIGTNTDTLGIRDSFLYNHKLAVESSKQAGKPGLVYGGGGASRAAIYALHTFLGCSKVYVVNRFVHEIELLAITMKENGFTGEILPVTTPKDAEGLEKPQLAVLCVPDFEPVTSEERNARATLEVFIQSPEKGIVIEMCYYPKSVTRLFTEFEKAQWKVISGIEPMIYQGIAQQVLWTGYSVEEMPVKEAIRHVYESLE
ncbi:hypothetical protein JCM33374_g5155 [Metschnikowia sp. JCM 33374]|nr:hypothetical protein JCM33374_g5155 [Metschnikowia sp. JCM 33374]